MKGKIVAAICALLLFGIGETAQASSRAECEVMTIHASNSGQGIDRALSKYETILKKSPFSGFNTFKLMNRQVVDIDTFQPRVLSLPDAIGGSLYLDRQAKGLLALTLTLTREGRKPIIIKGHASPGAPFFAAGMKSAQGVWVFGVACKSRNAITPY
jgi:hypothetical protein